MEKPMDHDDIDQGDAGQTPAEDQAHAPSQAQSAAVPASDDLQAATVLDAALLDAVPLDAASVQLTDSELLHAALALPPDAIAHVELTLDQLGDTVDLFDVPPFDYGDAG
jgi:hypothetical protein